MWNTGVLAVKERCGGRLGKVREEESVASSIGAQMLARRRNFDAAVSWIGATSCLES